MKNRTFEFEVSEMFRSKTEAPDWLAKDMPIGQQVRLIREALGMTQAQLARRCGIRQSMIAKIESDLDLDLRLSTMRKLARGLDCRLLDRLVPDEAIEKVLDQKSLEAAKKLVGLSKSTAGLEKQMPDDRYIELQVREMQQRIREKRASSMWDDH
ncbi:MAG TPA: helix-turn-helix domain-containing protein, partial [Candidatus Omnitrophota bacterium]|nr:helix-turn-helix domain-containing protein [Candidatus Omnitrophota bacterium]